MLAPRLVGGLAGGRRRPGSGSGGPPAMRSRATGWGTCSEPPGVLPAPALAEPLDVGRPARRRREGDWSRRRWLLPDGPLGPRRAGATCVAAVVARDLYRRGYSRVQGGRTSRRRRAGLDRSTRSSTALFFFLPHPIRLLILKDLRTFRRDPAQWSQFLIFFGLLAFYFLNIPPAGLRRAEPSWRNLVSFLNLSVTALILSTFTSRFIFPLLSLEGRNFWVLGLLPLRREQILWGKFAFSAGISLVATEVLVVLSDLMLRMSPVMIALHVGMVAVLCLGLSGISVGLGARLPNLRETDPRRSPPASAARSTCW